MATYDDDQGLVQFNDGEGLTHGDLNAVSRKCERKFWEQSHLAGWDMGRTMYGDYNDSDGIDPYWAGQGLASTGKAFNPFPLNGPVYFTSLTKGSIDQAVFGGYFGQKWQTNLSGTEPDGASHDIIMRRFTDEEYDIGAWLTSNAAPGSGNPRWDTFGFRLGWVDGGGDAQTRDFEDATTRAKTTASQNKEQWIDVNWEGVLGPQSATFDQATLSTGYVPFLTIKRPVGEGATMDIHDIYYQAYPMRFAVEDIMGYEAHFLGTEGASSSWDEDTIGQGSLEKVAAGSGTVYFFPRTMHAGCRLVGLGIISDGWNDDPSIEIGRFYYAGTGFATFTAVTDVGSGGPISGSGDGFWGVGELDWSPSSAKIMPIWGNGYTAGPLYAPERFDYGASGGSPFSKLAVKVSATTWAAGDRIKMMRFMYLH